MARVDRNERLKANYHKLKAAGYSAKEASSHRGRSDKEIEKLIRNKSKDVNYTPKKSERHVKARQKTGWRKNAPAVPKGITIKPWNTKAKNEQSIYRVGNRPYSYHVMYAVRDSKGNYSWKFATVGVWSKNKKEVLKTLFDTIFKKNAINYQGETPIKESVQVLDIYYNPDYI